MNLNIPFKIRADTGQEYGLIIWKASRRHTLDTRLLSDLSEVFWEVN